MENHLIVRKPIDIQNYQATLDKIEEMFNSDYINDELWVVQHPITYTQGIGLPSNIEETSNGYPVINVNRRGGISHHAPGQLACYVNVDMRRLKTGPNELNELFEKITIDVLAQYGLKCEGSVNKDLAGGYIEDRKIMLIGLEWREMKTSFGFAINVSNDLSLFDSIDTCGMGKVMTSVEKELGYDVDINEIADKVIESFVSHLNYTSHEIVPSLT